MTPIKRVLLIFFPQLIAAGVLDKADYPDFDEETGILPKDDDSGNVFCLLKSSRNKHGNIHAQVR